MSNIQLFLSLAGFMVAIFTWFRFDMNRRIDDIHKRIDDQNVTLAQHFDNINQRFADLTANINQRFNDQTAFMNKRFDDVHKRIDDLKAPPKQAA